jgi:hypothetical protein
MYEKGISDTARQTIFILFLKRVPFVGNPLLPLILPGILRRINMVITGE